MQAEVTRTKKDTFIAALRHFAEVGGDNLWDPVYERRGYQPHRGEQVLAFGIAKYLDDPTIPSDSLGINWHKDLHSHLVDAFVEFRAHEKWTSLRKAYELKTDGEEIPDLVEIHVGGLYRLLVVDAIAHLAAVLSGESWLHSGLRGYFHAQQSCIDQAWERFVRVGYRQLMPRIKKESHRGNSGLFGETTLMTYAIAGQVMFTFSRDEDGGSMTYVADDTDMHGERSGLNVPTTPYTSCVAMIDEVSNNWDLGKMKPDLKIGL